MYAYRNEKSADRRHIGELIRGFALRVFNLNVDKKYRIKKVEDYWPMPWDDEETDKAADALSVLTKEQRLESEKELKEKFGW